MELETSTQIAPEPKKKPRARRKAKTPNPAQGLLDALKFVKLCQKKTGTIEQQYCSISDNKLMASNGVLTIGIKIEEDLTGCPHTFQLEAALKKVGESVSIVGAGDSVTVASGDLKVSIPCVGSDELEIGGPDHNIAVIDDRIKDALSVCAPLATDGADEAVLASVLLQGQTAVSTNKKVIVECKHGIDLPPNMLIPRASVNALLKVKKPLVGFGYGVSSATFWFEDGSFIKTQLYPDQYVKYQTHFECENMNPWPVPDGFFEAVKTISEFTKEGFLYFKDGKILSNESEEIASSYAIEGLPDGMMFNSKYLMLVAKVFKQAYFNEEENKVYFFGDKCRGCIIGALE